MSYEDDIARARYHARAERQGWNFWSPQMEWNLPLFGGTLHITQHAVWFSGDDEAQAKLKAAQEDQQ